MEEFWFNFPSNIIHSLGSFWEKFNRSRNINCLLVMFFNYHLKFAFFFTKSFSNGSVPMTILALVSIHFKLFLFFNMGSFTLLPKAKFILSNLIFGWNVFQMRRNIFGTPREKGKGKNMSTNTLERGGPLIFNAFGSLFVGFLKLCWARNTLETTSIYCFKKHFSHRLTLLVHIYFPPQYILVILPSSLPYI